MIPLSVTSSRLNSYYNKTLFIIVELTVFQSHVAEVMMTETGERGEAGVGSCHTDTLPCSTFCEVSR